MEFISNYWEGIIATFAMIAASVSSILSYLTFKLQRTHNIKSVKPIFHLAQWDYENNLIVDLRNQGPGVGIVKSIIVYKNKLEMKTCIFEWLPKKLPGEMNYKDYLTAYEDFAIKAGEIVILLELPINLEKNEEVVERENIRSILRQLIVEIVYEDIYGNPMNTLIKKLTLYSRNDHIN